MSAVGNVERYTLKIVDGAELIESTLSKKIKINPIVSYENADVASRALAELSQGVYSDTSLITDISLNSMLAGGGEADLLDGGDATLFEVSNNYNCVIGMGYAKNSGVQITNGQFVGAKVGPNKITNNLYCGGTKIKNIAVPSGIYGSPTYGSNASFIFQILFWADNIGSAFSGSLQFRFTLLAKLTGSNTIIEVPYSRTYTVT